MSIYIKASVWDFPEMTEWTRLITCLLYGLFIMDLSLQSIKTNNWPADNFKKCITSMSCTFELWYSQVTLVSRCPFWQLSIDHNMDLHNDVHYQVKHRWYIPWTSSISNARSLQENNGWSLQENSQSECAHYCNHTCMYNKLYYNTLEKFFFLTGVNKFDDGNFLVVAM